MQSCARCLSHLCGTSCEHSWGVSVNSDSVQLSLTHFDFTKWGSPPSSFKRLNHFLGSEGFSYMEMFECAYLLLACFFICLMNVCICGVWVFAHIGVVPRACTYREAKRTSHVLYDFLLHSLEMWSHWTWIFQYFHLGWLIRKPQQSSCLFLFQNCLVTPYRTGLQARVLQGSSAGAGALNSCLHRTYCLPCSHLPSPKLLIFRKGNEVLNIVT